LKLLVGLGNPGEEYRATRHNVGYRVAEAFRRRHGGGREERRARSLVSRCDLGEGEILVARPLTYMNRSGEAVAALLDLAQAGPADLMVVCDDLNLELGTLRLRARGTHGGHNGLRSIIETLGSQAFPRLRVGVGPAEAEVPHAEFVLAPFRRSERARVEEVVEAAADCVERAVRDGIAKAMSRYNAPA